MISFYIYLPTGEITQTGFCPDDQFEFQVVPAPAQIAVGEATLGKQYRADNGTLVDMPAKPGDTYTFNYETKAWEPDPSWAQVVVLTKRLQLLQESDWTQIPNGPLTSAQQTAWATYRQELRDITSQSGYPTNVVWPTPPA